MTKYYRYNPEIKKEMVSKWTNSNHKYKLMRNICYGLYIIAFIICVSCFLSITILSNDVGQNKSMSFEMIGLLSGIALGGIPFSIGFVLFFKNKNEYGRPYNQMIYEYLCVDDYGIQYGYHNALSENMESMNIYTILYEDINRVTFNEEFNIVTITGCGELMVYYDFGNKKIDRTLSGRRFYDDSDFSFILSFDGQEEFLDLIKGQQNWYDKDGNFKLF